MKVSRVHLLLLFSAIMLAALACAAIAILIDMLPSRARVTPYYRTAVILYDGQEYHFPTEGAGIGSSKSADGAGQLHWTFDVAEAGRFGPWPIVERKIWRAWITVDRGGISPDQVENLLQELPPELECDWLRKFTSAVSVADDEVALSYQAGSAEIQWLGVGKNLFFWLFVPLGYVSLRVFRGAWWEVFNVSQRRVKLLADRRCPRCGYDTRNILSPRCPECGEALEVYP